MRRAGFWLLVLAGLIHPSGAASDATSPSHTSLREQIEVRRARAPIVLEPREPGGCDGITAEEIRILEDGDAVPALHLDPGPRLAVHAILVDGGPRMLEAVREARTAVLEYVRALPLDEPVLLATFDQRLILHSSLSTNRERFERSLERIEIGAGSHLWDSTRQLIEFLRSRPERKVLVLVTDGCDTQLSERVSPDEVIGMAVRTESLIVFPIGMNVPYRCEGGGDPEVALKELAEQTGGSYYAPKQVSRLGSIFQLVRSRMERERYVTYAPLPFGSGSKDRPRKQSYRWRKRKVDLQGKAPCNVVLSGPPARYESASRDYFEAVPETGAEVPTGSFSLDRNRHTIQGRVEDVVRESGSTSTSFEVLFDRVAAETGTGLKELTRTRKLIAAVPPFADVVRPDARPHDPIRQALARVAHFSPDQESSASGEAWHHWSDVPFLVNGRTLLDARRELARALGSDPDYGRWAFERIRAERLKALDELIRTTGESEDRETLERARILLAEQSWTPEPRELEQQLGAWLGDVSVAGVFNAAEAWLAQQLVEAARARGVEQARGAQHEAERLWEVLSTWLPEPEDARLIGLLIPGYDPDQDAVGFYRVILASPVSATLHQMLVGGSADAFVGATGEGQSTAGEDSLYQYLQSFNYSRPVPLGVRLVRWILEQEGADGELLRGLDVRSVHYAHPGVRDLHPTLYRGGLVGRGTREEGISARQVTVILAPRDDPSRSVPVSAYFRRGPGGSGYLEQPICLLPPAHDPELAAERELWRTLMASQRRADIPCVLLPSAEP